MWNYRMDEGRAGGFVIRSRARASRFWRALGQMHLFWQHEALIDVPIDAVVVGYRIGYRIDTVSDAPQKPPRFKGELLHEKAVRVRLLDPVTRFFLVDAEGRECVPIGITLVSREDGRVLHGSVRLV